MARRRYQTGRIYERGKKRRVFVGRWREDVIQGDGTIRRVERSIVLGTVAGLKTLKNAQRSFEPILAGVNSPDYRPGKFAKMRDFADTWEAQVLAQQKPSSVKAAQSHLKIYIRNWLGEVRLEDFTRQAQQNFVTRLSQRVSRKTVRNVLGTLGSMLRTAKSWGYCCHTITMNELALPAEEVRKQVRFFTGDQARKIIAVAAEPYRTMFAIAAMTGLRAGEVMGLQKADLDFDRRVIQVQRSAWYGRVQTVKSKASRAPVVMSEALSALLKDYLATWRPNPEGFLFLNRNGRPYAANKVVEYGLWPVLEKLNIPRAGMHAFRHCHASLLMDVGANPIVTKEQMRHSDARVTLGIYGHVIGDSQRDAVNKVGEVLRPDAPKSEKPGEWIQ
jgi:integrase